METLRKLQKPALMAMVLLVCGFLPVNNATALSNDQETDYIELRGVVTSTTSFIQEAQILVYEEDETSLYITELTNRMGRASIQLPLNRKFKLVFIKPGYIPKSMLIDTHIANSGKYIFKYKMDLVEDLPGLFEMLPKDPVALVIAEKDRFIYDEAYTRAKHEELLAIYIRYEQMQQTADNREQ